MTSLLLQIDVDRDYDVELLVRPAPIQLDELQVSVRNRQVYRWVNQDPKPYPSLRDARKSSLAPNDEDADED